jgi:hypothetical protein
MPFQRRVVWRNCRGFPSLPKGPDCEAIRHGGRRRAARRRPCLALQGWHSQEIWCIDLQWSNPFKLAAVSKWTRPWRDVRYRVWRQPHSRHLLSKMVCRATLVKSFNVQGRLCPLQKGNPDGGRFGAFSVVHDGLRSNFECFPMGRGYKFFLL